MFKRMSTFNKAIVLTLVTIFFIFSVMVIIVGNILHKSSIDNAKTIDKAHAEHIVHSVGTNLNNIANILNLTQDSLGMLFPYSD